MYIGFDLGTTGEKALLIDENQGVITSAVDRPRIWKAGHEVAIEVTGTNLRKKIRKLDYEQWRQTWRIQF